MTRLLGLTTCLQSHSHKNSRDVFEPWVNYGPGGFVVGTLFS